MTAIQSVVSLVPLEVWEVTLDNQTIKFSDRPLVLSPTWMPNDPDEEDENEYMEVEVPELAISSYGIDIEQLRSAIHSDIRFAWKHYVLADDSQLTPDALEVKNNYLKISGLVDG